MKWRKRLAPYILILPATLLLIVFLYGTLNGILQGFGIIPALGLDEPTLKYYAAAFLDSELSSSIFYSIYIAAVSSALALIGGIVLSALMVRLKAGRIKRLIGIQIPIMTSHPAVVVFIIALFSATGMIARLLFAAGFIDDVTSFPSVVGAASGWGIILTYLWKEIPYVAFCAIVIMGNVSGKFDQAAASLGASPIRTFFSVTLPLCKNALVKAFLVVFAFSFGFYEVPFLLGATLQKALPVMAYIEFQNPDLLHRPYAMALNGIMAILTLILAFIYFFIMVKEKKAGHAARKD